MALAQLAEAIVEEEWGCVKIATYAGPIYLASDEDQRARFARDGRAVFTRDEIEPFLRSIAKLDPYQRHLALSDAVLVKQAIPMARVEPIVSRAKEVHDESKGVVPVDPDGGALPDPRAASVDVAGGGQTALFR